MNALELVNTLKARGVHLSLEGGRIRYQPRSSVFDDDLERLKTYRAEVVKLLEYDPLSDTGWIVVWRERVQSRLQALENWVRREEYDLMRAANNALPNTRRAARAALLEFYFDSQKHTRFQKQGG